MAAQLPPTLWWVAQRSMRFLATLTLTAIVLTTGAAAQAADARPAAHEPVASTEQAAHPVEPWAGPAWPARVGPARVGPAVELVSPGAASDPAPLVMFQQSGTQHAEAEPGTGDVEIDLAGPAVHFGDPVDRAAPAQAVPPARPTGRLSGWAFGQRAPPRL